VLVVGRRLFDMTDGWGGIHPLDRPVVVMTHRVPEEWVRAHPGAPFTFVTDGTLAAIERAQEIAGDKAVGVNGGIIARRCLELGLLDEISLDLVPVLLGRSWPGTPLMAISCLAHRAGARSLGQEPAADIARGAEHPLGEITAARRSHRGVRVHRLEAAMAAAGWPCRDNQQTDDESRGSM
jgi:dihydrofolate reductase